MNVLCVCASVFSQVFVGPIQYAIKDLNFILSAPSPLVLHSVPFPLLCPSNKTSIFPAVVIVRDQFLLVSTHVIPSSVAISPKGKPRHWSTLIKISTLI